MFQLNMTRYFNKKTEANRKIPNYVSEQNVDILIFFRAVQHAVSMFSLLRLRSAVITA